MLDFSAIPVKLGEPKRLMSLGFGAGALILGVTVANVNARYVLFGIGLVAISMTLAGYLNPVTVTNNSSPDLGAGSQYNSIPAYYGKYTGQYTRANGVPYVAKAFEDRYASHDAQVTGSGREINVFKDEYGAEAIIPAGPSTLALAGVRYMAPEPVYLRYVAGVENEGKTIGQGG